MSTISTLSLDTDKLSKLLLALTPMPEIDLYQEKIDSISVRIMNAADNHYQLASTSAQELFTKLEALSPIAIMNRGYARVTIAQTKNLTSVDDVNIGDTVEIHLKDGTITAAVTEK